MNSNKFVRFYKLRSFLGTIKDILFHFGSFDRISSVSHGSRLLFTRFRIIDPFQDLFAAQCKESALKSTKVGVRQV